jgi:hypothetical protein
MRKSITRVMGSNASPADKQRLIIIILTAKGYPAKSIGNTAYAAIQKLERRKQEEPETFPCLTDV